MTCNIRKKFFAELLVTFFLVFIGTGAAVVALLISQTVDPNNVGIGLIGGFAEWIAIALAFGLTVMIGICIWKDIWCTFQSCCNHWITCN